MSSRQQPTHKTSEIEALERIARLLLEQGDYDYDPRSKGPDIAVEARDCEHRWYWRRRRNQDFGYWECSRCGLKTDRVPLDENGRAALTPEQASAREETP